jgi:DNA polymerase III subunit delta
MPSNIYLFHGRDNFSAAQKLKHWQTEFEKKYGDLNLQIFEGETLTAGGFSEATATVPFLSEKKLIIIRDFLRDGEEEDRKTVAEKLEQVPDYCIIVFIEHEKPDARTTLFKKLNKTGSVIEFSELEKPELVQWIRKEFEKKNSRIGNREAALLADTVGPDLWQMSSEVEKLALYGQDKPIDEKAIESLASPNMSSSIFKLTDFIAQRNARSSLHTLNTLLQSGDDLFQIFFMIVRHFRILIEIKACLEKKMDKAQITQKTREHPYAVMTGIGQCKNFQAEKLAGIYRKLLQIDIDSKSGRIKTQTADQSELRLALEKLIVELCA